MDQSTPAVDQVDPGPATTAPGDPGHRPGHVSGEDRGPDRPPLVDRLRVPLVAAGLASMALTYPLLDLYGRTPQYFVANDVATPTIVLWALVVAIAPPLVAFLLGLGAQRVGGFAGRALERILVFALGALLALVVVRPLDWAVDADVVFVAAVAGLALVVLERRLAPVRRILAVLCLSPVLFLLLFLFLSPSSRLVTGAGADGTAAAGTSDTTIVAVVFDELPLSSLLQDPAGIDAERFPNFARLATTSTWYRNTIAVSADTTQAVPSVLAGTSPDPAKLQTATDHPVNLFTVTGDTREVHAREAVTRLCPTNICGDQPADVPGLGVDELAHDTLVAFGHLSFPPVGRDALPRIDKRWGDFAGGREPEGTDDRPAGDDDATRTLTEGRWSPGTEAEALRAWIEGLPAGDQPFTAVSHVLLPHAPWQMTPTGAGYGAGPPMNDAAGRWTDDSLLRRLGFQRHLMQLAFADRLLGELFVALENRGILDDTLLVVTADHGANFDPGHQRSPTAATMHEVLRVPLFVKAPGQREGRIDDRSATSLDILPTIVDLAGIELPESSLPGRSLTADPVGAEDRQVPNSDLVMPGDLTGLEPLIARNRELLPGGAGWRGLYGVGPAASLFGLPESDLGVTPGRGPAHRLDQTTEVTTAPGQLPVLLTGSFETTPDGVAGRELVVVVNGFVAGSGVILEPGGVDFVLLTDERSWRSGPNEVAIYLPVEGGLLRTG